MYVGRTRRLINKLITYLTAAFIPNDTILLQPKMFMLHPNATVQSQTKCHKGGLVNKAPAILMQLLVKKNKQILVVLCF